jgi:hypothetical protein
MITGGAEKVDLHATCFTRNKKAGGMPAMKSVKSCV